MLYAPCSLPVLCALSVSAVSSLLDRRSSRARVPASCVKRCVRFLYEREIENLLIGRGFFDSNLLHHKRQHLFLRFLRQCSISRHGGSGGIVDPCRRWLLNLQVP